MKPLTFHALGFPVVVEPLFWLTCGVGVLYRLQDGGGPLLAAAWIGVVFVSVLVHELGHALTARALGVRVRGIVLHVLGGRMEHTRTTPGRQLAISLSGPAAGLLLGAVSVGAAAALATVVPLGSLGAGVFADLLFVNVAWSMFNLLPMLPLDGGGALHSGLALALPAQATRLTAGIGLLVAATLAFVSFQGGLFWVLYIAASALFTNWQILQSLQGR